MKLETTDLLQQVKITLGDPSDLAFVRAKTLHDLERFWPYRSPFDGQLVFKRFNTVFPEIVRKSQLLVARRNSDILAYIVVSIDEPLIYFAHTARAYRKLGLCKALCSGLERPFRYAVDNDMAAKTGKKLGGIFDPFALASVFERDDRSNNEQ